MANKNAVIEHAQTVTTQLQNLRNDGAAPHELLAAAENFLKGSDIKGIAISFPQVVNHPDGPRLRIQYWNGGGMPDAVIWLSGFDQ